MSLLYGSTNLELLIASFLSQCAAKKKIQNEINWATEKSWHLHFLYESIKKAAIRGGQIYSAVGFYAKSVSTWRPFTGCLRNCRKSVLQLRTSVLGRLRNLQYIFTVIYKTLCKWPKLWTWDSK